MFPALYAAMIMLMAAFSPQSLPPPPITNRLMFDEKLRLMRERPELDPEILGLGSSVAAQHLNTRVIAAAAADPDLAFNGAAQGLGIHQTRFLADFYLDRFTRVRLVVLLVAPIDFRECEPAAAAFMNAAAARRYAFDRAALLSVYFRHFDLRQFISDTWQMAERRKPGVDDDRRVYMDPQGYLPMEASPHRAAARGLRYGPAALDDRCFDDLSRLARDLQHRGVRLLVVINPVNPEFFARVANASIYVDEFRERTAAILARAGAEPPFDATTRLSLARADFFDAYHLQPWAADVLSEAIGQELVRRRASHGSTVMSTR